MRCVSEAVILMAGSGSRLRGADQDLLKPLVPLYRRPLVCYTLEALENAGISRINFIVGYERDRMIAGVRAVAPGHLSLNFIDNPAWEKQNGISVLAAAAKIREPFVLTMSDHVFDQELLATLLLEATPGELNLAIDRKIKSVFDLDDAMKVQTQGDRIVAIGKTLQDYNAIDTGLFVCPTALFEHLEKVKRNGDCSLADGVRAMAEENKAKAIDIGDAWWQDVDTPEMFQQAEQHLAARTAQPAV